MVDGSLVVSISCERWLDTQSWEREFGEAPQSKPGWVNAAWPVSQALLRAVRWPRAWSNDYWWESSTTTVSSRRTSADNVLDQVRDD
jgi:hypothetical protein